MFQRSCSLKSNVQRTTQTFFEVEVDSLVSEVEVNKGSLFESMKTGIKEPRVTLSGEG